MMPIVCCFTTKKVEKNKKARMIAIGISSIRAEN
jgi:hypothetical protein